MYLHDIFYWNLCNGLVVKKNRKYCRSRYFRIYNINWDSKYTAQHHYYIKKFIFVYMLIFIKVLNSCLFTLKVTECKLFYFITFYFSARQHWQTAKHEKSFFCPQSEYHGKLNSITVTLRSYFICLMTIEFKR